MAKIHERRVLTGGLMAGALLLAGSLTAGRIVSNEVVLPIFGAGGSGVGQSWEAMRLFGYVTSHAALGLVTVWLYASIRPRFGTGPRTAIRAGLMTWFVAVALPINFQVVLGATRPYTETSTTMLTVLAVSALLYPLAVLLGASIYREDPFHGETETLQVANRS